jgi:hypothetical protein
MAKDFLFIFSKALKVRFLNVFRMPFKLVMPQLEGKLKTLCALKVDSIFLFAPIFVLFEFIFSQISLLRPATQISFVCSI